MNKKKLLSRIKTNQQNVKYSDFIALLNAFGFTYKRTAGSHDIYKNDTIPKIVNAQNKKGEAKPYQVQQFLSLVEKYNLGLENE